MSTLEIILSRMMSEPAFAEALLANPAEALAEYNLSVEELEIFKGLSRTDFETLALASPEERKSLATSFDSSGRLLVGTDQGLWR